METLNKLNIEIEKYKYEQFLYNLKCEIHKNTSIAYRDITLNETLTDYIVLINQKNFISNKDISIIEVILKSDLNFISFKDNTLILNLTKGGY